MRYKIKASNPTMFREIRKNVLSNSVAIYVESQKRLMLSTDDLESNLISSLRAKGAKVTPEERYDLD